jgi:sterol desaturase/sphingolipid hydroxylase (fatty acid hydroxylase superfamily)
MILFGLKTIFITLLVFVPLERIFALHPEQKVFRPNWKNDLVFLFLISILTKAGLLVVIAASSLTAAQIVPPSFRSTIGSLPLWVQLPLAVLLSDLGFYWTHRMFHAVHWLWRFHEIHHSIEDLDWLA